MKWAFLITALIVGIVALYVAITIDGQNAQRADTSAIAGQTCIARGSPPVECYAMCNTRFNNYRHKTRRCGDAVYAASGALK